MKVKNVTFNAGLFGSPKQMYMYNNHIKGDVVVTFTIGMARNSQIKDFCHKFKCGYEIIKNTFTLEAWAGTELAGFASISFSEYDEEDNDPSLIMADLNWIILEEKYRGVGLGDYLSEQCGCLIASAVLQHIYINKLKEIQVITIADIVTKKGDKFFFSMVDFTYEALDIGCRISKSKFTLETDTNLSESIRLKGPRRKKRISTNSGSN